jgi:cytochrome c-type biogenesis protein CcmH
MMLWLILALMTAGALGAVVWPLVRAHRLTAAGSDLLVYRDQLEEIERDRTDARIGAVEAEAARVEVSRRLLAAADTENSRPAETGSGGRRRIAAVAAAVVMIPMLAVALYGVLGSPDLPGQPLASRTKGGEDNPDGNSIAQLIARVEAHLEENPDDGRGWEIVAPVYMKLERYEDAAKARRRAIALLGATAVREVDLGEALTAAANGVISEEAQAAFNRAIALDAENFKALFYLGLAAEQDGDTAEAARRWRALIAKAPSDAPWLTVVRQSLARVETPGAEDPAGAAPSAAAPAAGPPVAAARGPRPEDIANASQMTDQQRSQMIGGMVEQLATRLHQNGSDLDGWLRLLRAYKVLGDHAKAKAAVAEARAALASEPDKLRRLDTAIKDLDFGG